MIKKILQQLIIIVISCSGLLAQNDNSYKQLIKKYDSSLKLANINLKSVPENNTLMNKDSSLSLTRNINLFNEKKFSSILDIIDTVMAKDLMMEEINDLNGLNAVFTNKENKMREVLESLNSKKKEIDWLTNQSSENPALENCTGCFFSRTIKVLVLQRVNSKLDTMLCKNVDYSKNITTRTNLLHSKFNSYPCTESVRLVSTGRNHTFTLTDNNLNYTFLREIPPGKTIADAYTITLILGEN